MSEILDYTKEQKTVFVEATMNVSMSKSICFEMPEDYTDDELLDLAKKEIAPPDRVINNLSALLRQLGYVLAGADGWIVEDIKVKKG